MRESERATGREGARERERKTDRSSKFCWWLGLVVGFCKASGGACLLSLACAHDNLLFASETPPKE